jgi:Escherichia/Staphylococcus phage prohead protease
METKYRPLKVKTVPTDGSGVFTGLASTYGGGPDHQGDVVERGAFAESILRWRALGDYPPILFNHSTERANARIGKITSMQEIDDGLLITAKLNLQNKRALEVYEALLDGSLDQLSIGYATLAQYKRDDGKGGSFNVLSKLDLIEVSITPVPANPRARVLDVKSRGDGRDAKVREAQRLTNLVAYRAPGVPGLLDEVKRAAKSVVDDEDGDIMDLREAVTAAVTRRVTLQKYAEEDRAVARKWQGYAATRAVEELVADLAAGEKGQGRHESVSFDETNAILVREHLRQRHARVTPATLDSTDVRTLNQLHKLDHGGGVPTGGKTDEATTKVVDQLIAEAKADKAARQKFEDANRNLLNGPIDWAAQDAYDRARAAREQQELQQKWNERAQLADERDRAEASARSQAMTPMGAYWSNTDVQDVQDGPRERVTPRITDATVPDEGTTFRMPVSGTPDPTPLRVEPDDAVREAAPESGDTYRVIPFAVTDTPQTVPQEQERFSMPILTCEDSQPVLQEQPVPEVPEIGESFRLPAGGEVTETPKDGEHV